MFPLHQIAHVGVSPCMNLTLFGRELFSKYSNLCDHGTWTSRTDGQADRQTTYCRIAALCIASHVKNQFSTGA